MAGRGTGFPRAAGSVSIVELCGVGLSVDVPELLYSRSFVHTMVLSSMVVSMVIMAVGDSFARGLGILGSLAIVRFRTPVRDPRDMVFLYACMGLGNACGAARTGVALLGVAFSNRRSRCSAPLVAVLQCRDEPMRLSSGMSCQRNLPLMNW